MTLRRLSFLTFALFAFASPAYAIDDAGAARLKTIVQNFITEQEKLAELDGMTRVEYQGEVVVEQAGDYYAVTLPYAKIINPVGEQVDVGMVSINASEGDQPNQWKMRVAVPTPIVVTDKGGKEVLRITIAGQRAAGIWDETLQSFVKLDAQYKDMLFVGPEATVKLPETQIIYDFTRDAAGKWSGPGSMVFKNIEAVGTRNGDTFKTAEARIDFSIDQYDASAIKAYREKLAALAETLNKDPNAKGPTAAQTSAIAGTMMDFFTRAGNGVKVRYDITGVEVNREETGAVDMTRVISIPKLFLGMDLNGFNTGKVRIALQLGYNGLSIAPVPPESEGLLPTDSNFDIAMENIPVREIIELSRNTLEASIAQPEMGKLAGVSFLFKLPALLSQAGTYLTVTNTHIGNKDIDVKIEGRARADISAVNSATVDAKATFRGLDQLIAKLKEQSKTRTKADQAKIESSIEQLETVRKHARVETAPDGATLHILDLVMTPKGETLVNGKDLRTILLNEKPPGQKTGLSKPAPMPGDEPPPEGHPAP